VCNIRHLNPQRLKSKRLVTALIAACGTNFQDVLTFFRSFQTDGIIGAKNRNKKTYH
jgi:hypothetical protein